MRTSFLLDRFKIRKARWQIALAQIPEVVKHVSRPSIHVLSYHQCSQLCPQGCPHRSMYLFKHHRLVSLRGINDLNEAHDSSRSRCFLARPTEHPDWSICAILHIPVSSDPQSSPRPSTEVLFNLYAELEHVSKQSLPSLCSLPIIGYRGQITLRPFSHKITLWLLGGHCLVALPY